MERGDDALDAKKLAKMCGPGSSNFWVLGSNHKTGTELHDAIEVLLHTLLHAASQRADRYAFQRRACWNSYFALAR